MSTKLSTCCTHWHLSHFFAYIYFLGLSHFSASLLHIEKVFLYSNKFYFVTLLTDDGVEFEGYVKKSFIAMLNEWQNKITCNSWMNHVKIYCEKFREKVFLKPTHAKIYASPTKNSKTIFDDSTAVCKK